MKELSEMNIYERIQAVSHEVRNIAKDMTVGKGNYSYKAVSDLDVTLAVKDAEKKFGLVSIPVRQEIVSQETLKTLKSNGDESFLFVCNIKMTLQIVNLDKTGEEVFVESFGMGLDSADKGFGKASTYARKYALLNAYKIATGEDPDAEKSKEVTGPASPSEKLVILDNYFDKNLDGLQKLLAHFNVAQLSDLSEKQVNTVYSTYKQKGLI